MTTETDTHDAFAEARKSARYWVRVSNEELHILDLLERLLPSFVGRRYRISSINRVESESGNTGRLTLAPVAGEDSVEAANALHADVAKLYDYLLGKREPGSYPEQVLPIRKLGYNGTITYEFTLRGLFGFEGRLDMTISGLPAGSACRITKKVTGTKVVDVVEYEMECDDDPPSEQPHTREELEAKGE